MNKKIIIGIGVLLVVAIGFFALRGGSPTGGVIIQDLDAVKIPLSEIPNKASFYEYEGIEYFTVKTNDGTIKTAFDACDVCYNAGRGYSQEGNDMVCNNCGNHYPINGLGTRNLRGGGCWPGYLPSKIQGDYLVIKKSDLEEGRYRF